MQKRYIKEVRLDSKYVSTHNYIFYFLGKEVKGMINSLPTYYSDELKKFSGTKKVELSWMTPTLRNMPISLKLVWLVCFKLIWSCKHRIRYYNFWFRKCVNLIKLVWLCISGFIVLNFRWEPSLKESTFWRRKNVFYSTSKALFVLEIPKF